jgi:hypothetical protein
VTGARAVGPVWRTASVLIALGVLAPVLSLVWLALGSGFAHWAHLAEHVLPQAALNTAVLLAGVGVLVLVIGTGCAWLVTACDFPGATRAALGAATAARHADLYPGLSSISICCPSARTDPKCDPLRCSASTIHATSAAAGGALALGLRCCCSASCSTLMSTSPPAPRS